MGYAIGSDSLTRMAAYVTAQGGMAVVGGGDSLLSVQKLEQFDNITHVSTGGGAMLEFIEGKVLPGVEVLDEKYGSKRFFTILLFRHCYETNSCQAVMNRLFTSN